jgi:hypothetical protein
MTMAEPDNAVDLGPAARRLADLVASVKDDALERTTPCPAYSLGDLIEHVGGLALAFTAAGRKEPNANTGPPPAGDASRLGADWRERIPRDLAGLAQAWAEPEAWTGMTRSGQPYACEPEILAAAVKFLQMFASPDAPAGPEVAFGPARVLLDEAPLLDRVVGLAGRDPGWSPA